MNISIFKFTYKLLNSRLLKIFPFGFILVFFLCTSAYSQTTHVINSDIESDSLAPFLYQKGTSFHPSIKPFITEDITNLLSNKNSKTLIDSVSSKKRNLQLTAYPLAGIFPGYEISENKSLIEAAFGASVLGNVSNKISFQTTYIYTYADFPEYSDSLIGLRHVAPTLGYAHPHGNNYSYNNLSFYANYKASDHFLFEGGFGKNAFGDGYRSLFLSENAYNYPYFKITTTAWRIKYINLYAQFNDISEGYYGWKDSPKKYGSFQFLSWNITKRLNLNFFEAVIWQAKTKNNTRGFDINYLNPVIFMRPVEFSLGSPDNALLGFGFHYKILKSSVIYGQLVLDEFMLSEVRSGFSHMLHPKDSTISYGSWFNKQAIQIGFKTFDIGGIKNLQLLTEINYVRPYTYSHREVGENYAHFNQPLAHPFGANFIESVSFLKYQKNKFSVEAQFLYALIGLDSGNTHFGQDIYKSTYDTYMPDVNNIIVMQHGNKVAQGIRSTLTYKSIKFSYLICPKYHLRFDAGLAFRDLKSDISKQHSIFIYAGINAGLDMVSKDY
jgi:hypothetical protein